jgi:hypothetical protein
VIHVYWADMVPGLPWWAGPVTRQPRAVYWQPLSDLVERRVNASVDTSGWGSDVLVELTVPDLLSPDVAVLPGFAVAQLALPEALNRSRDVELVVAALEDGVHATVERVARRLGAPYARTNAEPVRLEHPLRLSALAGRFGGTIALVAPHSRLEEFVATLNAAEVEWEGYEGWRNPPGGPCPMWTSARWTCPCCWTTCPPTPQRPWSSSARNSNGSRGGCRTVSPLASR